MASVVRTCRQEDLGRVTGMLPELYREYPERLGDENLESRLSEFFLVGEVDGRVVGFVIGARGPVDVVGREMARESFPGAEAYLEVQDLYVVPEWRGQGIGSQLMRAVLERGREAGLECSMV